MEFRKDMDFGYLTGILLIGLSMTIIGFVSWLKTSEESGFFLGISGLTILLASVRWPLGQKNQPVDESVVKAYEKAGYYTLWIILWYSIMFGLGSKYTPLGQYRLLALDMLPVLGLFLWGVLVHHFHKKAR